MSARDAGFADAFTKETWALYGVGMVAAALRCTARIRRLGFSGLQIDDYLMVFSASVWYTLLCVSLNQVVSGGGSNLMTEEDIRNLTPAIHAERVKGSKWVFVSEHAFLLNIFTLKAVMLLIYARITNGLGQRRLVNYCAVYVGIGFLVSELTLFLMCRPLSNYWAVPTPNYQCSSYQYYEIIQGVFAISADIFMLVIAIPLLMAVRLPWRQKSILLFLFGLGVFVIVAAILTKVYCLVPSLISYAYLSWYFREATVAMLVTSLPLTWSLLRDVFPSLKSWTGGSHQWRPSLPTWSRRMSSRPAGSRPKSGPFDLQSISRLKFAHHTGEGEGEGGSASDGYGYGDWKNDSDYHGSTVVGGSSVNRSGSGSGSHGNSTEAKSSCEIAKNGGETNFVESNQIRQEVTITVHSENESAAGGSSAAPSPRSVHFDEPRRTGSFKRFRQFPGTRLGTGQ